MAADLGVSQAVRMDRLNHDSAAINDVYTRAFDESKRRIEEAARWIAGGVNSNFRAGVSPTPLVVERAEGAYLIDADGNRLIDYYLGMGPMILGHSPASVKTAVAEQLGRGLLYGAQSEVDPDGSTAIPSEAILLW